jgi:hypothetical protein
MLLLNSQPIRLGTKTFGRDEINKRLPPASTCASRYGRLTKACCLATTTRYQLLDIIFAPSEWLETEENVPTYLIATF